MRPRSRAVSEIVAAMLLISIVVAATFIIWVYSSNLLGSLQGAQPPTGQYSNQLTLEYYDWTNTPSATTGAQCSLTYAALHSGTPNCATLILVFRNVGSGVANIAAYYVNGIQVTYPTSSTCTLSGTTVSTTTAASITSLSPQASCSVTLTMPTGTIYATGTTATTTALTITVGVPYSIQIATTTGGVFQYTCVAGQRTGSY